MKSRKGYLRDKRNAPRVGRWLRRYWLQRTTRTEPKRSRNGGGGDR